MLKKRHQVGRSSLFGRTATENQAPSDVRKEAEAKFKLHVIDQDGAEINNLVRSASVDAAGRTEGRNGVELFVAFL